MASILPAKRHNRLPSSEIEEIIRVIQEEGRTARNIVSWSVSPKSPEKASDRARRHSAVRSIDSNDDNAGWKDNNDSDDGFTTVKKRSSRRGKQETKSKRRLDVSIGKKPKNIPHGTTRRNGKPNSQQQLKSSSGNSSHRGAPHTGSGILGSNPRVDTSTADATRTKCQRKRGRRSMKKQPDSEAYRQSRLWGYLLSNLMRSIDEIYDACEHDQRELQCEEVIQVLVTATTDFTALIRRFRLHSAYEATTTSGFKPAPLAWSVRKIYPSHTTPPPLARSGGHGPSPSARGKPNPAPVSQNPTHSQPLAEQQDTSTSHTTNATTQNETNILSYADRVKGRKHGGMTEKVALTPVVMGTIESDPEDDGDVPLRPSVGLYASKSSDSDSECFDADVSAVGLGVSPFATKSPVKHRRNKGARKGRKSGKSAEDFVALSHAAHGQNREIAGRTPDALRATSTPTKDRTRLLYTSRVDDGGSRTMIDSGGFDLESVPVAAPSISPMNWGDVRDTTDADTDRDESTPGGGDTPTPRAPPVDPHREPIHGNSEGNGNEGGQVPDAVPENAWSRVFRSKRDTNSDVAVDTNAEDRSNTRLVADDDACEVTTVGSEATDDVTTVVNSDDDGFTTVASMPHHMPPSAVHHAGSNDDEPFPLSVTSPGSTVLLHHRLSSPSRKRSCAENTRISAAKQARATEARARMQQEMTERLRKHNTGKIEAARERREVKEFVACEGMAMKMQRAEELRDSYLEDVRRKAQLEEAKVEEIAFITRLEHENMKSEVLDKLNESQERLLELEEERQRKVLEKVAREDAVAERRRAMEAERAAKMLEQENRRQARAEKAEKEKQRSAEERREREKANALRRRNSGANMSPSRHEHCDGTEGGDVTASPTRNEVMSRRAKSATRASGGNSDGASSVLTRGTAESEISDFGVMLPAGGSEPASKRSKSAKKRLKRIHLRFASSLQGADDVAKDDAMTHSSQLDSKLLTGVHPPVAKVLGRLAEWFTAWDGSGGIRNSKGGGSECGFGSVDKTITALIRVCGDRGNKLRSVHDRVAVVHVVATVASRLSVWRGGPGLSTGGDWERLQLAMYAVVRDACRGRDGRHIVCKWRQCIRRRWCQI
eukprot:m.1443348 g.1443348  ORF g.1443348 m.1443348 type:complete len:1116 (-) comp25101_c1_seq2:2258-5605(-)